MQGHAAHVPKATDGSERGDELEQRVFPYSPPERSNPGLEAPARDRRAHHVRPGDTLWSIAHEVLETDDPARVARYWPKIHRANRSIIGADPSLILPGQVLELPPEHST
ncbi:MAG: LysM peptidoglycan-binding domain-containing protein [Actinomycetota bacterium]